MEQPIHGQILDETDSVPPVHDVTPGWIGRNRTKIERGRNLSRVLMVIAPPPARVPLAADAMLLADEMNRRLEGRQRGSLRIAALAMEGAVVLAATRFAPARLAANLGGIEAARHVLGRVIGKESPA